MAQVDSQHSTKRTRHDCISQSSTEQIEPPRKKSKIEIKLPKIFDNASDQHQFEQIFEALNCTQLTKQLKTADCIISIIAQYATGYIEQCSYQPCSNLIIKLHGDNEVDAVADGKYYRQCDNNDCYCYVCMIK
eukprot:202613_1